mmetsp:Transcript_59145/g.118721  ORF Transcript_59145/g.118721 Transcript_59145/m.118721 type:complete len:257 (-) Transcript_59145:613-1383(-)
MQIRAAAISITDRTIASNCTMLNLELSLRRGHHLLLLLLLLLLLRRGSGGSIRISSHRHSFFRDEDGTAVDPAVHDVCENGLDGPGDGEQGSKARRHGQAAEVQAPRPSHGGLEHRHRDLQGVALEASVGVGGGGHPRLEAASNAEAGSGGGGRVRGAHAFAGGKHGVQTRHVRLEPFLPHLVQQLGRQRQVSQLPRRPHRYRQRAEAHRQLLLLIHNKPNLGLSSRVAVVVVPRHCRRLLGLLATSIGALRVLRQ